MSTTVEAVRLYSVAAVAEHLGMSRVWVYAQINGGKLRAVELGSTRAKTRVRADDLQAFIDSRTFGIPAP
jgi:excisionase family DNA binding protein